MRNAMPRHAVRRARRVALTAGSYVALADLTPAQREQCADRGRGGKGEERGEQAECQPPGPLPVVVSIAVATPSRGLVVSEACSFGSGGVCFTATCVPQSPVLLALAVP